MDIKKLDAYLHLAVQFNIHLIKKLTGNLIGKKRDGFKSFIEKFKEDKITYWKEEERRIWHKLGYCINCIECDEVCPILLYDIDKKFNGPRSIAIELSRNPVEIEHVKENIFKCIQCKLCDIICPQDVKISELNLILRRFFWRIGDKEMPEFIREKIERVNFYGNLWGIKSKIEKNKIKTNIVLYRGCVGSYLVPDLVEETIKLLELMDIKVNLIDEYCCGYPFRQLGLEVGDNWLKRNRELVEEVNAGEVITICPGCFNSLKNSPYFKDIRVRYLYDVINFSALGIAQDDLEEYAIHYPCLLSRNSNLGEKFFNQIKGEVKLGVAGIFPEYDLCCGAGSGMGIWDKEYSYKFSKILWQIAIKRGKRGIITFCPTCNYMLRKVKPEENLLVKDYISLIMERY